MHFLLSLRFLERSYQVADGIAASKGTNLHTDGIIILYHCAINIYLIMIAANYGKNLVYCKFKSLCVVQVSPEVPYLNKQMCERVKKN